MALAQDNARDVWLWPWLQGAAQDLRFAARCCASNLTFTVVVVLTLARRHRREHRGLQRRQ